MTRCVLSTGWPVVQQDCQLIYPRSFVSGFTTAWLPVHYVTGCPVDHNQVTTSYVIVTWLIVLALWPPWPWGWITYLSSMLPNLACETRSSTSPMPNQKDACCNPTSHDRQGLLPNQIIESHLSKLYSHSQWTFCPAGCTWSCLVAQQSIWLYVWATIDHPCGTYTCAWGEAVLEIVGVRAWWVGTR